jgi:uncharacterized phage protein (TIGR02218 family)
MKATTAPLRALLATGQFVRADLWTITLAGGGVVRWTSHDQTLTWLGNTFVAGPLIDGGTISEKIGTEVAKLDVTITALPTDLINGTPVLPFIAKHGFDGALVKLERVYAANWSTPLIGSLVRFSGKITSIKSIVGAAATFEVSSWLVLLNVSAPRNLYQGACLHTLYDSGCTLNAASYVTAGAVTSAGTASFGTNATSLAGRFNQGRIVFTSGANSGVSRTVKSNDVSGNVQLILPLPAAVAIGDTFNIYAGCDLSMATCSSKFGNLAHFKGMPFVPVPTTALGATTTTTTSGK